MIQKKTYPIPALAQQIELEWNEELAAHWHCRPEEVGEKIRSFALPRGTINIVLMDESCVEFRWAYFVVSEAKRTIAVFTEQCGNHLFPYHEARIYRDGELVYEQIPVPGC